MDITDIPDDAYAGGGSPSDFDEVESLDSLLKSGPIREHLHPPPDTSTPGEDGEYPNEWRDVLASVLIRLDKRIEAFWNK